VNFIEKTQVKMLTVLELSEELERVFSGKGQSVQRIVGELKGIVECAKRVEGTHHRVEKVFEAGKLGKQPEGEAPMTPEERQLIKRWIEVAAQPLRKLLDDKQAELENTRGEYRILDRMLEVFKKKHDKWASEVELVKRSEETGDPVPLADRPAGLRPESMMDARRREEAEEQGEQPAELPETPDGEVVALACPNCGKPCKSQGGLKIHMRACKLSPEGQEADPTETDNAEDPG